jgi:uncharacterized protein with PIN domain
MGKKRGGKGRGHERVRNVGHCYCKAINCLYRDSSLVNICSGTFLKWV